MCDIGSNSLKMDCTKMIRMICNPHHEIGSRLTQMLIERQAVEVMVLQENAATKLVEIC